MMPPRSHRPNRDEGGAPRGDWLTTREASALVGVSSATLRRWCDAGAVTAFTTPGGHRRLARSAVLGLLPRAKPSPRARALPPDAPRRLTDACRRGFLATVGGPAWVEALPEPGRLALRRLGRRLAVALPGYLDASAPDDRQACVRDAEFAAAELGRIAAASGASIGETVELFLWARAPLIREIATIRPRAGLDTIQAADLLEGVIVALDQVLAAVIDGHQRAWVPGGPTTRDRQTRSVPRASNG